MVAPCVVVVLYHNATCAVNNGNNISLPVPEIEKHCAVVILIGILKCGYPFKIVVKDKGLRLYDFGFVLVLTDKPPVAVVHKATASVNPLAVINYLFFNISSPVLYFVRVGLQ